FGLFTAIGIASALVLEMTFIPALRSLLPPPGERESTREQERRLWDRIIERIAKVVRGPRRWCLYVALALLIPVWVAGAIRVVVDTPLRSYFAERLTVRQDDNMLNARLGGSNTVYVLIEGAADGAMKEPATLRAMAATQRFLVGQ